MKRVEIHFAAIAGDGQVKSEEKIKEDGYFDYEDAVLKGGVDAILHGSYAYGLNVRVLDEEALPGEHVSQ